MDKTELKCKDCKPPQRNEHCHSTCEYYLKWKEEKEEENKKMQKKKWLKRIVKN